LLGQLLDSLVERARLQLDVLVEERSDHGGVDHHHDHRYHHEEEPHVDVEVLAPQTDQPDDCGRGEQESKTISADSSVQHKKKEGQKYRKTEGQEERLRTETLTCSQHRKSQH
jgi:hypothetical protein